MENTRGPDQSGKPEKSSEDNPREYEKSGLYPETGKPFRMFALLGWLGAVVILMAAAAAILDYMLI
jgi:hypothetical protein